MIEKYDRSPCTRDNKGGRKAKIWPQQRSLCFYCILEDYIMFANENEMQSVCVLSSVIEHFDYQHMAFIEY